MDDHPRTAEARQPRDLDRLFREHNDKLVRVLQRTLRLPRETAEDATAFAWEQLLRKDPGVDRVDGWLFTVAKHEAFSILRRAGRERLTARQSHAAASCSVEDVVEARDVLHAIRQLKPQQQTVLHLRLQGYSYATIAERAGRTNTWVNRHMVEGRAALRQLTSE